jgi:uncharacterized membrane protein YqiK
LFVCLFWAIQGHLRAILGTMTVEEVYKEREEFAIKVSARHNNLD